MKEPFTTAPLGRGAYEGKALACLCIKECFHAIQPYLTIEQDALFCTNGFDPINTQALRSQPHTSIRHFQNTVGMGSVELRSA